MYKHISFEFFQCRYQETQSFKPFFPSPLSPFPVNKLAHLFAQVLHLFEAHPEESDASI